MLACQVLHLTFRTLWYASIAPVVSWLQWKMFRNSWHHIPGPSTHFLIWQTVSYCEIQYQPHMHLPALRAQWPLKYLMKATSPANSL